MPEEGCTWDPELCVTAPGAPLWLSLRDCCSSLGQEDLGLGYKKPRERWMGAEGEHDE